MSIKMMRSLSTVAAKSFEEIPGPKSLPLVGTLWMYFPFIGKYKIDRLHESSLDRLKEFGPIVKEQVAPGIHVVHVYEPEDIEKVYKSEGKFPTRRSHLAIEEYRTSRPSIYNNGGIITTNGEEWWRLRRNFQKSLSRLKDVRSFLPTTNEVIDEFIQTYFSDGEETEDFQKLAARLGLELSWTMMFGERLDRFGGDDNSIPYRLMTAAEATNCNMLKGDLTEPIWKNLYKTSTYTKIEKSLEFIESVMIPKLKRKMEDLEKNVNSTWEPSCLLDHYLTSTEVDFKDVSGIAIDLVLGGVDTTSYTSSFITYHLGTHLEVQEKLKEESHRLLPSDNTPVTPQILNDAVYTRAVLKESFRLNPIAIGISRTLGQDAVMGGYHVPKGTIVITHNMSACRLEKHFKNPDEFRPERWLKESKEHVVSPYLILPFSHGSRTCIARRAAEQNLLTLFLKLNRVYSMKWTGQELDVITPLICKPNHPVKLLFNAWK